MLSQYLRLTYFVSLAGAAPARIPLGADKGMKTTFCFREDAVGIARAVTVLLSVISASPQIKARFGSQLNIR